MTEQQEIIFKTYSPCTINNPREIPRIPYCLGTSSADALEIVREHYLLNPECQIFGDFMNFLKFHKLEKLIELEKNKIGGINGENNSRRTH